MLSAVFNQSSSSEDEDRFQEMNFTKRKIRFGNDFMDMPNNEFKQNFRMSKETFRFILNEISPHMKTNFRSTAISNQIKLATALRFLATGGYQKGIGNEFMSSLSQAKVCFVIDEYLGIMEQYLCSKWVKFNISPDEEMLIKQKFYGKFNMPGVIGCVDGTHIKIMAPREEIRHLYYNRKGYYSLNAMKIWDGGYQCLPYLLTPYRNPSTDAQIKFNTTLTKARNCIERCYCVLKNRFRCLIGERGLHYSPEKAKTIINVCCVLHNICIFFKNDWPPMEEVEQNESNIVSLQNDISVSAAAESIRNEVANIL
ncbi:putative nuclease HARBI1 [Lucilia cuprina]|uniref:putative nuclease HARBI1 n=1 Tax=Lucilia cuprina TaxID=7375 RepID=UPI001F07079D|nr:putative nuclease HARBI1 [Lucilia cuprina]